MLLQSNTTTMRSRVASRSSATAAAPRLSVRAKAQTAERPKADEKIAESGLKINAAAIADELKRAKPVAGQNAFGLDLGPIGLLYGANMEGAPVVNDNDEYAPAPSIHTMTTAEWRAKYENADGTIDLWVEEEFNAGSRLVGGRAVHLGGIAGFRTGEGISAGNCAVHKVKIYDHYADQVVDIEVPEDRYILYEAEDNGLELPYACRLGVCTACAVKVKEGEVYQPEALGISQELKNQGYALMCVGYPSSDCVLETVTEDEIYDLQFGKLFAQQALDPNNPNHIERDDFALSVANMDE